MKRGSIKKRYTNSYSLTLDLGYQPDPTTGQLKRKRKWITFHGNLKAAQKELTNQLGALDKDTFVEPSKTTLLVWLRDWLTLSVKPTARPATYVRYHGIVENHVAKAAIAGIVMQKLRDRTSKPITRPSRPVLDPSITRF